MYIRIYVYITIISIYIYIYKDVRYKIRDFDFRSSYDHWNL